MRPEVGAQTRFKKKLPPAKYRYDDSLAPSMEWDGQNPARDKDEWLLALIEGASALPAPHKFIPTLELRDSQGAVVASTRSLRLAVRHTEMHKSWKRTAIKTAIEICTKSSEIDLQNTSE